MADAANCSLGDLEKMDIGATAIWGTQSRVDAVSRHLECVTVDSLDDARDSFDTLVVVGGGARIDAAKKWRAEACPELRLVAVPSVWGSGAEASPIVVQSAGLTKEILIGSKYLPDFRCIVPELADSLTEDAARYACGDAWSHAMEGFLSPLADEPLRRELANLMQAMSDLPIGKFAGWYELSARACQGQSKSSVGLVHGIAHTLEGPLRLEQADLGWGHARLCALFLYPVALYNRQASPKFESSLAEYGLEPDALIRIFRTLFSKSDYDLSLQTLRNYWPQVLRDPCTRTNSALVRRRSLSFFIDQDFA